MLNRQVFVVVVSLALATGILSLGTGAAPKNPNDWSQLWKVPDWLSGYEGTAEVTSAVVHEASGDTYTYSVKNLTFGTGICEFTVPGQGCVKTIGTSEPSGWTVSILQDPCGMGTWWTWTASTGNPIGVGATATFSIRVSPPTWEHSAHGSVAPCGLAIAMPQTGMRTDVELSATPAACNASGGDFWSGESCNCFSSADPSVCVPLSPPSATAQGIQVNFNNPGDVHIVACEPFWIMHGFIGGRDATSSVGCTDYLDSCDASFELYVDGVPHALTEQVRQAANGTPGELTAFFAWFAQFPSGYFDGGTTHTLMGRWTQKNCDGPGLDYQKTRTVTLVVDPCPEPSSGTPVSLLKQPDLAARIVSSNCNLVLEGRTYKLDVAVWAEIENVGSANAMDFHIKLVSPAGEDEEWVEGPLAPGEKKLIHLEATSEDWTCCCYPPAVPCPSGVSIEVTADSQEQLIEPSEANNTAEDECPCS